MPRSTLACGRRSWRLGDIEIVGVGIVDGIIIGGLVETFII